MGVNLPVVVLCLLSFVTSGLRCARGPSLDELSDRLREAAGAEAIDCGRASLHEPAADAVSCASVSLTRGDAFHAAFQVQGIDSTIYQALVRPAGGEVTLVSWDSDIYGGSRLTEHRRISRQRCPAPSVQLAHGGVILDCHDGERRPPPDLMEPVTTILRERGQ